FYNDSMYPPIEIGQSLEEKQKNKKVKESEKFLLKAMNCPFHVQIYKNSSKSYKDLPIRLCECSTVYRFEKKGELSGLTRVRGFTQDDAHIICRTDQVEEELNKVVDFIFYIFNIFGFSKEHLNVYLSLRDPDKKEKYAGDDKGWEFTETMMRRVAKSKKLNFTEEEGEAAFYGPKLDFMVKDALGRQWQLGTIQVDYNLPERFELEYTGADNQKHRPVMIHRAPLGSMERFVAVLIEHTAGKFPLWLTPDQVVVLPISEKHNDYAKKVLNFLNNCDIRTLIDDRNEKIGKKIRDNELKRIPYLLIVGEKEVENETVSVRVQGDGDKGSMKLEEFADLINKEVKAQTEAYKIN
ncbi:MAG: threonine--tRNA ligase, partial [Bacteroidales bacterium]|nr:threonine--tRNA ligase [Bacteroidales bacterium]